MVRNVADLADAPTTSRNSRTMSVWTSDELRAFFDAISDHYLYPLARGMEGHSDTSDIEASQAVR